MSRIEFVPTNSLPASMGLIGKVDSKYYLLAEVFLVSATALTALAGSIYTTHYDLYTGVWDRHGHVPENNHVLQMAIALMVGVSLFSVWRGVSLRISGTALIDGRRCTPDDGVIPSRLVFTSGKVYVKSAVLQMLLPPVIATLGASVVMHASARYLRQCVDGTFREELASCADDNRLHAVFSWIAVFFLGIFAFLKLTVRTDPIILMAGLIEREDSEIENRSFEYDFLRWNLARTRVYYRNVSYQGTCYARCRQAPTGYTVPPARVEFLRRAGWTGTLSDVNRPHYWGSFEEIVGAIPESVPAEAYVSNWPEEAHSKSRHRTEAGPAWGRHIEKQRQETGNRGLPLLKQVESYVF